MQNAVLLQIFSNFLELPCHARIIPHKILFDRKEEWLKRQPTNLFTVKVINKAAVFGSTEG
jgi:hypothetical protein